MKRKIVGILVVTLLIAATVLPVVGTMNNGNTKINEIQLETVNDGQASFTDGCWQRDDSGGYVTLINNYDLVGIGTDTPARRLHITNPEGGAVVMMLMDDDGKFTTFLQKDQNDYFAINQGHWDPEAYPDFYITDYKDVIALKEGKVGFGTGDPKDNLHILDDSPSLTLEDPDDTDWSIAGANDEFSIASGSVGGIFAKKLVINMDGNVGFGTGDPKDNLHILDDSPSLTLEDVDDTDWKISGNDDEFSIGHGGINSGLFTKDIIINNDGDVDVHGTLGLVGNSYSTIYNFDDPDREVLCLNARTTTSDGAAINLYGNDDPLEENGGFRGQVRLFTEGKTRLSITKHGKVNIHEYLQIFGGSDISEPFDVSNNEEIIPGMVVVIDTENPGELKISDKEYDRCAAGIISGAGGVKPGIILSQEDFFDGENQVALAGRVYCYCDASYGSIQPGDLLTTSPTLGHAMKVTDYERAQGAVIGKAMTNLEEGQGLVLILVSLQ